MLRSGSWRRINAVIAGTTLLFLVRHATNIWSWNYQSHEHIRHDRFVHPDDFKGFNNETGDREIIVPNIVHFLRFELPEFRFIDAICILAVVKNQKPHKIYIHTNIIEFTGKYWKYLLRNSEFRRIHEIRYIEYPDSIFGQKLSLKYRLTHASDITRIKILQKFGGIFLDNDCYLVQNLNKFRKFEMTLNWDDDNYLGTQTLIAHSKARFLSLWLKSYEDHYNKLEWYYNAGEFPTQNILVRKPYLIHRVKQKFGAHTKLFENIYFELWPEWRTYNVVHLLVNHREYLDPHGFQRVQEFDEVNFEREEGRAICDMIRDVVQWSLEV